MLGILYKGVLGQAGGHPKTELSREEEDTATRGHGHQVGPQGISTFLYIKHLLIVLTIIIICMLH